MLCLWDKSPLTTNEILELSTGYSFHKRSIHSIMKNLEKKMFIKIEGTKREGKKDSRLFVPLLSRDKYLANKIETDPVYAPEAVPYIVCRLIPNLSTKTIEKLRAIVEDERNMRK